MARQRVLLDLDAETLRLLETLTTPRRKTLFISKLIHEAAEQKAKDARLIRIEERLAQIEEKLDQLLKK